MEVVFSSDAGMARENALAYVDACKRERGSFRVLDIGGAANPWSGADCYVDFHRVPGADTIVGDIHDPSIWKEIAERRYDFCICSHILEDIRDPIFVLNKIREHFRHGYIAVPNKHVEFSHIESRHYVGFGHHRWIYTLAPDELRLIAKFPLASYFTPRRSPFLTFRASFPSRALRAAFGFPEKMRDDGPLIWWKKDRSGPGNELAFIWRGELRFRVINGDHAGHAARDLGRLYREELAQGL
jgi:hypothetical protein